LKVFLFFFFFKKPNIKIINFYQNPSRVSCAAVY
jgi:hypothetical protein